MQKYRTEEYYSVIDKKTGRKICDCGWETDAWNMVQMDPENRTISRNKFLAGPVIDVEVPKALPTSNIVASPPEYYESMYPEIPEETVEPLVLPQSDLEPLNL